MDGEGDIGNITPKDAGIDALDGANNSFGNNTTPDPLLSNSDGLKPQHNAQGDQVQKGGEYTSGINPNGINAIVERVKTGQLEPKMFANYDPVLQKAILDGLGDDPKADGLREQLKEVVQPQEKDARDEVLEAFNDGYNFFIEFTGPLEPQQEAERDYLKTVKEATVDKGRGSRRIRFKGPNGTEYSEQEYLPVDTLINFLRERIKSGELTPEKVESYKKVERILHANAKEHYRTANKKELLRKQARIDHESKRVSSDPRLSQGNPHDDDLEAGRILFRRRELVLPAKKVPPPPPPPPPRPPVPPPEETPPDEPPPGEKLQKEPQSGEIREDELEKWGISDESNTQPNYGEIRPDELDKWTGDEKNNEPNYGEIRSDQLEQWVGKNNQTPDTPTSEDQPTQQSLEVGGPPSPATEQEPEVEGDDKDEQIIINEDQVEPEAEEKDGKEKEEFEIGEDDEEEKEASTAQSTADVRREIMIANRTMDLQKRARELAEEHLRAEQRRGSLLNPLNWARKTRLRVLEEFYRQRYISEAMRQMLENNNTYLGLDLFAEAATNAQNRINEERAAGQAKLSELRTGENLAGQNVVEVTGELKNLVWNSVVSRIVNGEITEHGQVQQALREFVQNNQNDPQVAQLFGNDATRYGTLAEYFASDLLEVGQRLRQDKEAHGYAIERLKELTTIKLANASWGADTGVQWTLADRAIAWSQRGGRRGLLTNPAVVGALTSIGVYGGLKAVGVGGRALLAAPGAGLLVGASLAAVRRAHDLKVDRASHQAEREYGATTPENAGRRQALDTYQYEMASFSQLLNGGERNNVFGDNRGLRQLLSLDVSSENPNAGTNRDAILRRAAEIRARLDFGTNQQKGLITYEGRETIEQNRLELVRAVAEARVRLRSAGMTDETINNRLTELQGEWTTQFTQNTTDRDRSFNLYRTRQALYSAGIGGVTGLALGVGGASVARGALDLLGENAHIAGLENIPHMDNVFGKTEEAGSNIREALKENKPVELGDATLLRDDEGRLSITLPDGESHSIPGTNVTEEGTIKFNSALPTKLQEPLKEAGFDINTDIDTREYSPPIRPDGLIDTNSDYLPGAKHGVEVPKGTGWVPNAENPDKWDLVVSNTPPDEPLQVLVQGVSVDAEGNLAPQELVDGGIISVKEITENTTETKPVFGDDGLWNKEADQIARREWYAYDTPYSDHNELRAYNSVFTAANGEKGVVWDMSQMQTGYQSGVNPPSINVQEVIKNGEAGFAFTLPDAQGSVIFVSDASDGVLDGKIRLDPSDFTNKINPSDPQSLTVGEFSKVVLNQEALKDIPDGSLASELTNRQNVFNLGRNGEMGFIEAARLKDENGQTVLQAFATGRGASPTPETVTFEKTITTSTFFVSPREVTTTVTEIIPPSDTNREIPIIPWVMTPRFPLERMTPIRPIPPPYYPFVYNPVTGGAIGINEKGRPIRKRNENGEYVYSVPITDTEDWKKSRSKKLLDNPQASLDQQEEINDYFERMNDDRRQRIVGLSSQIATPLSSNTKGVICIPAAAALETDNIIPTLELLTQQSNVTNDQYEVILYLNWMNDADMQKVTQTKNLVTKFQREHPNFPLRVVTEQLSKDSFTIGDVMKTVNDIALNRIQSSGKRDDVMLTVLPADVKGLSRRFTEGLIKNADGDKDIYTSPIEFGTTYYKDYPGFHVSMRALENIIRISEQAYPAPVFTAGSGLQKKASILAAIGGYDESKTVGEDADIGMKTVAARLGGKNEYTKQEFPVGRSYQTWNEVDPARLLERYRNGSSVLTAWNDFTEGGYKGRPLNPDSSNESIDSGWNEIVGRIESQLSALNGNYDSSLTTRAFNLALGYTENSDGSKSPSWVRNSNGTVSLTNDGRNKLKQALKEYLEEKKYDARYRPFIKSGNPSRGIKPNMPVFASEPPRHSNPPRSATTLESSAPVPSPERRADARAGSAMEKKPSHPKSQDAIIVNTDKAYVGAFDGLGGHGGGDIASEITSRSFQQELDALPQNPTSEQIKNAYTSAYQKSIEGMKNYIASHPDERGLADMSTTASVVRVFEENGEKFAYLLQSGDSRSYSVLDDGSLSQISQDQSLVYDDVVKGRITQEEANRINQALDSATNRDDIARINPSWTAYWNSRNVVTGVIDAKGNTPPISRIIKLTPQTKFIITTSDGVHDNLTPDEIKTILSGKTNPQEAAQSLLDAAKRRSQERHFRSKADDIAVGILQI